MTVVKYRIPTRGLLGIRNALLTATRGTAVINTIFMEYGDLAGDLATRDNGSLVSRMKRMGSLCRESLCLYAGVGRQAWSVCTTCLLEIIAAVFFGLRDEARDGVS